MKPYRLPWFQQIDESCFIEDGNIQLVCLVEFGTSLFACNRRSLFSCSQSRRHCRPRARCGSLACSRVRVGSVPVRTNVSPLSLDGSLLPLGLKIETCGAAVSISSRFRGTAKNSSIAVAIRGPISCTRSRSSAPASMTRSMVSNASARNCAVRSPTNRIPRPSKTRSSGAFFDRSICCNKDCAVFSPIRSSDSSAAWSS